MNAAVVKSIITFVLLFSVNAIAAKNKPATFDPVIAFDARESQPRWDIVGMDDNGNTSTIVGAKAGDSSNNRQPTWSPDGSKLAFARADSSGNGIWMVNPDGTGMCKVADLPAASAPNADSFKAWPAWSPSPLADNQYKIVYEVPSANGGFDLYLVNAACPGGTPVNLTLRQSTDPSYERPTWSPDAKRIAASDSRSATPQLYAVDVLATVTGGTPSYTFSAGQPQLVNSSGPLANGASGPDWANRNPNLLAVTSAVTGTSMVFTLPTDNPGAAAAWPSTSGATLPTWSPEDSKLAVVNGGQIVVIDTAGSVLRTLRPSRPYVLFQAVDWRICDRILDNGIRNCAGTDQTRP